MFQFNTFRKQDEAGADGGDAGAGGTGDGGEGGAAPSGNFYDSFADAEVKNYAIAKDFKDPESVVLGYKNLEKLAGVPADMLIKLPNEDAEAEAWNPVYDQLGRPATAEDYGLTGDAVSPELLHELGLNTKQAKALEEKLVAQKAEADAAAVAEYETNTSLDAQKLQKEWGAAHDKNMQLAKQVSGAIGLTAPQIDSLEKELGFAGVMKMLVNIGSKFGEDSFVDSGGGDTSGITMDPAVAQAKIAELRADKGWSKKYLDGDVKARKEMENLHKMAYPE